LVYVATYTYGIAASDGHYFKSAIWTPYSLFLAKGLNHTQAKKHFPLAETSNLNAKNLSVLKTSNLAYETLNFIYEI